MTDGKFIQNPAFEKLLLRSKGVRDVVEPLAEAVADSYRADVPVDSGDLQESIFSDVGMTAEGIRGRVGAKAPHAGLVEFGTFEHPPDGSLRRAVDSIGGDFVPHDGS